MSFQVSLNDSGAKCKLVLCYDFKIVFTTSYFEPILFNWILKLNDLNFVLCWDN